MRGEQRLNRDGSDLRRFATVGIGTGPTDDGERVFEDVFTLGLLGQVYVDLGHWSEAEPLLVESVNALARTQPRGDPGLSQAVERLAKFYDATGRTEEARKMRESGGAATVETVPPR